MSAELPKMVTNSLSDTTNRTVITIASIVLAITGYVDIKNIDRTYELVNTLENHQKEFLGGMGAASSESSGKYFREMHESIENSEKTVEKIFQELEDLKRQIESHHKYTSQRKYQ